MNNTEKFNEFHQKNPDVYRALVRMCNDYRNMRGYDAKIGIATLWENLRWHYLMRVDTSDQFKLNNNYKPHYARLIMQRNPQLDGIFELREQKNYEG